MERNKPVNYFSLWLSAIIANFVVDTDIVHTYYLAYFIHSSGKPADDERGSASRSRFIQKVT
jgi:hypothetical protein